MLGHYIRIEDKNLLLGNSRIRSIKNELHFYFSPFENLFYDGDINEALYNESDSSLEKNFEIMYGVLRQKSDDMQLSSSHMISVVNNDERFEWGVSSYDGPLPKGFIKNHVGKFDVMAYMQLLDFVKNYYGTLLDNFSVKNINPGPWKSSLKEMGMNVGKPLFYSLRFLGFSVDEKFNSHYLKTHKYAKNNGFV
ncbi:MAG: hypothetical protein ACP5NV_02175 [Candidatus Woesearchaeota archaeon]